MKGQSSGIRAAGATCGLAFAAVVTFTLQPVLAQVTPSPELPSVAVVEARLVEIEQSVDLDPATKTLLRDLYRQTLSELESAARWRATSLDLASRTAAARDTLAEVEAELETEPEPEPFSASTLDEAEQSVAQLQSELDEATRRLVELDAEPLRRVSRRAEIRQQLADLEARVNQLGVDLAAAESSGELRAVVSARSSLLAARRMNAGNQTASLQQELLLFDAEAPLLPRQRELMERTTAQLNDRLAVARDVTGTLRREDASRRVDAAREVDVGGYARALATLVAANARLAERRVALVDEVEAAERDRNAARSEVTTLSERFGRTRDRVTAIGQVPAVGLLLRNQRDTLPDLRLYRRRVNATEATTRVVQTEMFDLDEQRRPLADLHQAVAATLLDRGLVFDTSEEQLEAEAAVESVLETRRAYLDLLLTDLGRYFEVLVEIGIAEHQIISETEAFLQFIDERILWTRSADRLTWSDVSASRSGIAWLLGKDLWRSVGLAFRRDIEGSPELYALALAVLVVLLRRGRSLRRALVAAGERASARTTVTFTPTAAAFALTVTVAALGPAALWGLGFRLGGAADTGAVSAVANGVIGMAVVFWPLEFLRQACRPGGLLAAHFEWPIRPVTLLSHHVRWLIPCALPLVFVMVVMASQDEPGHRDALGRLALIALQGVFAIFLQRVLRPEHGVFHEALVARPGGWLSRLRFVWYVGAVVGPIGLAGVAVAGYVYTADLLVMRGIRSLWLAVGLSVAHGLMSRWALVNQRSLAMRQRRERLRAAVSQRDSGPDAAGGTLLEEAPPDLFVIDRHTRQLIRAAVATGAAAGVWVIWSDMIPAMRVLDQVTLWTLAGPEPGMTQAFTLQDLVLTVVLATVTTLVARNVPSVIEMTLLQRLPLMSGVRYAITTMTRYTLGFVGVTVIFGALGVTWSSVQWLVAAFGVGLGFGLQEIFANFVSGIILLFERPVRVGDTVTIGGASGTVMRIRMRATTILDWDLKELVIPNKDLVTGQLVNWTLSDSSNRITLSVGVAYGSDPAHVTRVLESIVRAEPRVLKSPEPVVTFQEFGESTLNFAVRAYLAQIHDRLPVTHNLHCTIAAEFKEQGIEIAFPQLDVHVRPPEPIGAPPAGDRALAADHEPS